MPLPSVLASVVFTSDLISAGLALLLVYLTFKSFRFYMKSFRSYKRDYLIGFPIGFSFLAVSYLLEGFSHGIQPVEIANWISLLARTYGFAFIGTTYFLMRKRADRRSIGRAAEWALLVVLALLAFLITVVPPFMELPSLHIAKEIFYAANVGLVGYIIFSLDEILKSRPGPVSTVVVLGFGLLFMAQFSGLIWALEDGFYSPILSHALRIAGLATLVIVKKRPYSR